MNDLYKIEYEFPKDDPDSIVFVMSLFGMRTW